MQSVANISVLAMFVMYLLTATFGYLTFYQAVEPELLLLLLMALLLTEAVEPELLLLLLTALLLLLLLTEAVEPELLHTFSRVDPLNTLILCVRLAVLVAVTLTVPVVLFPVRQHSPSTNPNPDPILCP
uniref:Uncharacterized protein n=1 Tax=Callorhinchus milii TaxID=7868 RepID=A0A4W3H412_CALMI|eukprot:gi/632990647/ref/XP_007884265.1/ PREDICTED: sodium-coupled neutral amino acid transporter 5 isoform X1 [Callorhinchus milii]